MHEHGLIKDLISRIEQEARREGATRIRAVHVRLGALSHLSVEHFLDHFRIASAGTIADGARVEIELSEDLTEPGAQGIFLRSIDVEDA